MNLRSIILFATPLLLVAVACSNDMQEVQMFEHKEVPNQEIIGADIRRSEYGNLQAELQAPLIQVYQRPVSQTVYPEGITLRFYNNDRQVRTSLTAKYAVSYDDKNIMEARDSVVIIDYGSGDTTYLEDITWNKNEDKIFSDHPLRSVHGTRVTIGDGFVSDGKLKDLHVKHQRGTIEFNE